MHIGLVHPRYKTKYGVANWAAYNQALVRRGDVTVWVSSEAIVAWTPRRSGRRGGQRRYSDLAIETALTLRLLYHLPLRQAEGFLHALFGMMRLDLSAPDYTTLSRRSQHLRRAALPVSRRPFAHARRRGGRRQRLPRHPFLAQSPHLGIPDQPVRLEFPIFSLNPGLRPRGVAPDVWPTRNGMATRSGTLARIRLRAAVRRQSWRKRVGTPAMPRTSFSTPRHVP